jgi:DNA-binding NarL/FixJ family response regulator
LRIRAVIEVDDDQASRWCVLERGYLLKDVSPEELGEAIRSLASGDTRGVQGHVAVVNLIAPLFV